MFYAEVYLSARIGDLISMDEKFATTKPMNSSKCLAETLSLCDVHLFRFKEGEVRFLMAPNLFLPDEWTEALLIGLAGHYTGRSTLGTVMEIGIGSGIVPLCLVNVMRYSVDRYIGIDINPVACEVSRLNLSLGCPRLSYRILSADILANNRPALAEDVDLVLANVPQMPMVSNDYIDRNNYYLAKPYQGEEGEVDILLRDFGLELIYNVLEFSVPPLRERAGAVIFTLSGRCGAEQMHTLVSSIELRVRIVHTIRVRQDVTMNIEPLISAEKAHKTRCEFFANPEDFDGISAAEAIEQMRRGEPVYHDLHVVLAEI